MNIRTTYMHPNKILKQFNAKAISRYNILEHYHEIILPYRPSTKTRLHEMAHCLLGHCADRRTWVYISEFIEQELEAEIWATEKCDNYISLRAIIENVINHEELRKVKPNLIFSTIARVLSNHHYILDRATRSYLWNIIKIRYKER